VETKKLEIQRAEMKDTYEKINVFKAFEKIQTARTRLLLPTAVCK
jgi:hypothetical protein